MVFTITGVSHTDRVKQFLTTHPGRFYCNRCLGNAVGALTIFQVRQITRLLRGVRPYRSGKMICVRCGNDRECIAYG